MKTKGENMDLLLFTVDYVMIVLVHLPSNELQ